MSKKRVELTVQVTGTRDGEEWPPPGTVVSLDGDEADGLVRAGLAKPVRAVRAPAKARARKLR